MELPERIDNHITETSSYKIFLNNIPDSWIVREVTERDYGIDCYIELVNTKKQVTGELISIQLKSVKTIKWTKDDYYTFSGVKISTTNYWNRFPTPVFLCLVDLSTKEVFYCPIKSCIRKNYFEYAKQKKFSYRVKKNNQLGKVDLTNFILSYFREKWSKEFRNHLNTFISHFEEYKGFILNNTGHDLFMGVSNSRVLYLKHIYNNVHFLANYFDINWELKSLKETFKFSQLKYGEDYEIYEEQIDEMVTQLEKYLIPILIKVRDHVTKDEEEYYIKTDLHLYNVMINVHDDGKMSFDWN